jgi:hypothetical protein
MQILDKFDNTGMKREGIAIVVISLASFFIGIFDIFFNQDYSSLTMVLFSGVGFTGGFLWMAGRDLRTVPISYFICGTFLALGFVWQGLFTKNIPWILVGVCTFLLFGILAYRQKEKNRADPKGEKNGK